MSASAPASRWPRAGCLICFAGVRGRGEALLKRGDGDVPIEAARPETEIEDDAALAAGGHRGIDLAVSQQLLAIAREAMRIDVAPTEFVEQRRREIARIVEIAEFHHDRYPCLAGYVEQSRHAGL